MAHVLEALRDEFQRASTPEPLQSTVHLLALVLQLPWATGFRDLLTLMLMQEEPSTPEDCRRENSTLGARRLTVAEAQQLDNLVRRRIRHEPLQYLAGQWDFLDSTFLVRAPLLCPRPETEELVLLVLDDLHPRTNDETKPTTGTNLRILDVGCGTGCIGLALADKLRTCTVQAVDVEPIAVEIAAANAVRMGCAHRYSVQQVAAADYSVTGDDEERFDVVVSNPPYIPDGDMLALEPTVVNYESASALQGGSDGMDVIRTIVQRLPLWCKPGAVCWMEVDPTHPALLRAWLTTEEGSRTVPNNSVVFVSSHRDLSGRDRFVKLRVV